MLKGVQQEAIKLIYGEGDILYLSIHSLHKIAKFNGKDGHAPKLYKLGSKAWKVIKQKTKSKVKEIAFNLIRTLCKTSQKDWTCLSSRQLFTARTGSFFSV